MADYKYEFVKVRGSFKAWGRKMRHLLRYNGRYPSADLMGKGPGYMRRCERADENRKAWVRFLLSGVGGFKRATAFGWMGDGVIKRRVAELGVEGVQVDEVKADARRKREGNVCRSCGGTVIIDPEIIREFDTFLNEINLLKNNPEDCWSGFYILQKNPTKTSVCTIID